MQASLKAVLLACALVVTSTSYGVGLCEYLGIGSKPCGCGNPNCCDGCEPDRWIDGGCGCEASCGCGADCGCDPSCGAGCGDCCEASCGCGSYCVDGRKFAGRTYNCGCESYMPMSGCTGPACCEPACGAGCGDCCESSCGCEANCGCACGDSCEPSCGCGGCPPKKAGCCTGMLSACGRMCAALCGGGSCGCSGEMYWSEWHNDPPRCCDPCNRCGQWVGPSTGCGGGGCATGGCNSCGPSGCGCNGGDYGGMPSGDFSGYALNRPSGAAHGGTTFAAKQRPGQTTTIGKSTTKTSVARTTPNPYTKARAARRPQQGVNQQVQR